MAERSIIPFGPQHPVLPEPIHLDLVLEDERIIDVVPSIGYIHRGLEILVNNKDYLEMAYVAERICGICSFVHGMGYCSAVEQLMDVQVPERALWLRTIWTEFSRLQSHLLWLGLVADAMGFESMFMHSWRVRELILDIFEETTGGRIIFGVCTPGGSRRDIDNDMLARILVQLKRMEKEILPVLNIFENDPSIKSRLGKVGILTKEEAHDLGCVGPMARASGLRHDVRSTGSLVYGQLGFEPMVEEDGDCLSRTLVRTREVVQSLQLIRKAISGIPDGPVFQKPVGMPAMGDSIVRFEQPRGEVVYWVRGNGTKFLSRFRARTPTFANIPAMVHMMKNAELAEVALLVLTIDPCISCTER